MSTTETTPQTRTVAGVEVPSPGTFALDPSHSQVGFVVRHLVAAKVRGHFTAFEGTITVGDEPAGSSVEVTIQADSFDTRDAGRDEHVRSADFLDVEHHPTLTFRSTGVRVEGDDWKVDGELTIRGVTKPVVLDLEIDGVVQDPWGNQRLVVSAETEINREDFGLTWNQALETGGVMVAKKVKIVIEAEAIRQA
jgi:polyisoprenoid-binding protein YceI